MLSGQWICIHAQWLIPMKITHKPLHLLNMSDSFMPLVLFPSASMLAMCYICDAQHQCKDSALQSGSLLTLSIDSVHTFSWLWGLIWALINGPMLHTHGLCSSLDHSRFSYVTNMVFACMLDMQFSLRCLSHSHEAAKWWLLAWK